jgi:hypothetical protein
MFSWLSTIGSLMTDRGSTLLAGRVKRIEQVLGRSLVRTSSGSPVPLLEEEKDHLIQDGKELYWNELEWEKLTGEEQVDQEFLTELAFPGFLAYLRGLLLDEVMPDALAPAQPRPEVVESLLAFVATRVVELQEEAAGQGGEDREHTEAELKMTSRLVDLVLYLFYDLGSEEIELLEAGSSTT